ncbi:MAG: GAF domain-containing protein [Chloroflexota bacterium]|nr:GAF domain-containing protein [Chloroflexota bacterium]
MEKEIEIRLQRLGRILEFSRELASTMSLEPLLHKIVEAAAELTSSEVAAILLLDKRTGGLRFVTASNLVDQLVDIPVPINGSIAGIALSSGKPLIVPNARTDPRHYKMVDQLIGLETRSLLAVPLQFKDRRIGVLEAENKRDDGEFCQDDVETLTVLAAQATVAIENARLVGALQEARDDLERRVEERTAELSTANTALMKQIAERQRAEEVLRQYTAELEARNEELDAFAHTVAHDLKGPLNTLLGFARLLPETWHTIPAEKVQGYLQIIANTGGKMNNIIDELLLLASTRKEEVETTSLDMANIVAEVQQRLAYTIQEYQAEIIVPDNWPLALGYAPWIEEVWVNYISNAIIYGGSPPRVELGAAKQEDSAVRFWVRDNGPGLSPEEQARLFIPYTQLHQVHAKGHGLGLSIVRRIVKKLDGQVGVESKVGEGSVFVFTLPGARQ